MKKWKKAQQKKKQMEEKKRLQAEKKAQAPAKSAKKLTQDEDSLDPRVRCNFVHTPTPLTFYLALL